MHVPTADRADARVCRASLTAQDNVFAVAIAVAEGWGYRVDLFLDLEEEETWHARKDDFDFFASTPVELLGTIAIHRAIEPARAKAYWWQSSSAIDEWANRRAAAQRRLEHVRGLISSNEFREKLRTELRTNGGIRSLTAQAMGLTLHELDMILDLADFAGMEE